MEGAAELARRGFGFLAVFCARRRRDTREDSQEETAQNEGVRVASGGQPHGPDQLTRYQQVEDKARMRMSVEKIG